jgi:bifunctional non-homologous end joining protein LigD
MMRRSSNRCQDRVHALPWSALPVHRIPGKPGWVYELELDGFKEQTVRDEDRIRLYSRNGKDFTRKFPRVTAALKTTLQTGTALDGELLAFDKSGRPIFAAIRMPAPQKASFLCIRALQNHGKDRKQSPLSERLALLLSASVRSDLVQHSEHFIGAAEKFLYRSAASRPRGNRSSA